MLPHSSKSSDHPPYLFCLLWDFNQFFSIPDWSLHPLGTSIARPSTPPSVPTPSSLSSSVKRAIYPNPPAPPPSQGLGLFASSTAWATALGKSPSRWTKLTRYCPFCSALLRHDTFPFWTDFCFYLPNKPRFIVNEIWWENLSLYVMGVRAPPLLLPPRV